MKNKITITLTFLVTLIIPAGFAFAYSTLDNTIYVQDANPFNNRNITNSLDSINNSIQANTKAFQTAQIQQRIDALDQGCVKQMTDYINTNETFIKDTDKNIADYYNAEKSMDMSNPSNQATANSHLDYLYALRDRQTKFYQQLIINECANYRARSTVSCPANSSYASNNDGKCYCSSGYQLNSEKTACVATPTKTSDQICQENKSTWNGQYFDNGNPQCTCLQGFIPNTEGKTCIVAPVAPIKTNVQVSSSEAGSIVGSTELNNAVELTAEKKKATVVHEPTIAKHTTTTEVKVSSTIENKVPAEKDNVPVKKLPYHKGVIQKAWEWATGLFHF